MFEIQSFKMLSMSRWHVQIRVQFASFALIFCVKSPKSPKKPLFFIHKGPKFWGNSPNFSPNLMKAQSWM